jgi:hypothetical protein
MHPLVLSSRRASTTLSPPPPVLFHTPPILIRRHCSRFLEYSAVLYLCLMTTAWTPTDSDYHPLRIWPFRNVLPLPRSTPVG